MTDPIQAVRKYFDAQALGFLQDNHRDCDQLMFAVRSLFPEVPPPTNEEVHEVLLALLELKAHMVLLGQHTGKISYASTGICNNI